MNPVKDTPIRYLQPGANLSDAKTWRRGFHAETGVLLRGMVYSADGFEKLGQQVA